MVLMHCSLCIVFELQPVTQETSSLESPGYTRVQGYCVNTHTSAAGLTDVRLAWPRLQCNTKGDFLFLKLVVHDSTPKDTVYLE